MPQLSCFEYDAIKNRICCCGCSSIWHDEYKAKLSKVDKDLKRQLDLVFMLKRLRLHGFALTLSIEKNLKSFLQKSASNVCIEDT